MTLMTRMARMARPGSPFGLHGSLARRFIKLKFIPACIAHIHVFPLLLAAVHISCISHSRVLMVIFINPSMRYLQILNLKFGLWLPRQTERCRRGYIAGHTFTPVVNSFVEEDLEPLLTEAGRPDWGKLASAWERTWQVLNYKNASNRQHEIIQVIKKHILNFFKKYIIFYWAYAKWIKLN